MRKNKNKIRFLEKKLMNGITNFDVLLNTFYDIFDNFFSENHAYLQLSRFLTI